MMGSGLFISLFRQRIGPLFVDDLDVTQEVAHVAPICAGYQIFDGIAGTSSGVLRCNLYCFLTSDAKTFFCGIEHWTRLFAV